MAEEVIAGVVLAAGEAQPRHDHRREINENDRYVEGAQGWGSGLRSGTAKSPRRARAWYADGRSRGQTVKDDPQPQPPVAFGFSNAKPDSWKLLL